MIIKMLVVLGQTFSYLISLSPKAALGKNVLNLWAAFISWIIYASFPILKTQRSMCLEVLYVFLFSSFQTKENIYLPGFIRKYIWCSIMGVTNEYLVHCSKPPVLHQKPRVTGWEWAKLHLTTLWSFNEETYYGN